MKKHLPFAPALLITFSMSACGSATASTSSQTVSTEQASLLATLAPKNRVEALEDEEAFMKSVIKSLSQEVADLKKAQ